MPSEPRVQLLVGADSALHTTSTREQAGTVQFTDVDWVMIPAREEKKEKAGFWDAVEGWSEEEIVEDVFYDALDLLFFTTNASTVTAPRLKGNGNRISWTRRFQGRRRRRKRKTASVRAVRLQRQGFKTSRRRRSFFLMPRIQSTKNRLIEVS